MSFLQSLNPFLVLRLIIKHKYLFKQLVRRNIEIRYKGSVLGLVWCFIQPLMLLCVYTFVFSFVFKARWGTELQGGRAAFAIVLFCGMAIFNIFSESVTSACSIISSNTNYVKKVIFPLEILPIAQVVSTFLFTVIWLFLVLLGSIFILKSASWTMLLLPLTVLPLLLFTTGCSFILSSVGVYIKDVQYFIIIVVQMLFFMTPIFYPIEVIPERFRWVLQLNPLALIIGETRNVFLYGKLPNWGLLLISFLTGCIVFQLGFVWFVKTKRGFADVL